MARILRATVVGMTAVALTACSATPNGAGSAAAPTTTAFSGPTPTVAMNRSCTMFAEAVNNPTSALYVSQISDQLNGKDSPESVHLADRAKSALYARTWSIYNAAQVAPPPLNDVMMQANRASSRVDSSGYQSDWDDMNRAIASILQTCAVAGVHVQRFDYSAGRLVDVPSH